MPYNKNDILTVEINDIGVDGEGIGKVNGYTLFIKDAIIGDTVKVKIMKAKKSYAYAHLEEVVKPSPFRTLPKCEFHKSCGGCQIQALSYDKQLEFKESKVKNNLIHIGDFSQEEIDSIMEPIVGMENPYHYRGKAQFPFGMDKAGNPITGFYAGRTHSIIANTDCLIGVRENEEVLKVIINHMKKYKISSYNESDGSGDIRHVLIRKGFSSEEVMVCIVINSKKAQYKNGKEYIYKQEELIEALKGVKGIKSISVSLNHEKTNVIMGSEIHTIWGDSVIHDTIHICDVNDGFSVTDEGIEYAISPLSFYQVNPVQTEKLYSIALSYAALSGKESVWDLYCGIGTISLFLAKHAGMVYGVEIVPQAIDDAISNARANGITNAKFFVGKSEEVITDFYENRKSISDSEDMLHPDVIVVDPPRKGCDIECLETMVKMSPSRIVYVSCDSATLSRDLRILVDRGYKLEKVRAVDMFPHSVHCESCVLLIKENK